MRTDNDTWDISTSVGSTALFVAAARALEAQKPDPLAVDPYAEVFCRAVGGEWADLHRGWSAEATPLPEYLRSAGRPVPAPDSDAGSMTSTISLVSATKR